MLAAGLTIEQALIAAEAFETESAVTNATVLTPRQARNKRYYERRKASENRLESDDQDVQTLVLNLLPPKVLPPHPLLLNPNHPYPLRPLKGALPPRRSTRSSRHFRKWRASPGFPCRGPSRHPAVARCCCGSRNTACRRSSMPSSGSAAAGSAAARTTGDGVPTSISSASPRASFRSSKANTTTDHCSNRNRRPGRKARPCSATTTSTQG
ncbi:hypothetical protein BN406_01826 [Sinorhizobium meliloti Rm41]|nr:hypothetical protein BN406_01826 [Sinorhizobium meliloti Rm41]